MQKSSSRGVPLARHCEEPLRRSNPHRTADWIASLPLAMTNMRNRSRHACFSVREKWRPVFGPGSCALKKREAERREAHCPVNVRAKRGARLPLWEMRRLSALTLAALATGYHPDGSAPEPGFPRRWLTGVLPASLDDAAVKHAPCRPVLMPVDRGPESRPSAMLRHRPRGPQLAPQFRFASGMRPSVSNS